jgi:hypothetical protein
MYRELQQESRESSSSANLHFDCIDEGNFVKVKDFMNSLQSRISATSETNNRKHRGKDYESPRFHYLKCLRKFMKTVNDTIAYPDGSLRHCSGEAGCENLEVQAIKFFHETIFFRRRGVVLRSHAAASTEEIKFLSVQEILEDHMLQKSKVKSNHSYYKKIKQSTTKTPSNSSERCTYTH